MMVTIPKPTKPTTLQPYSRNNTTYYRNPVHAAIILCCAIMFDISYNLFTKSPVQTALILYILTYNNRLIPTFDFS